MSINKMIASFVFAFVIALVITNTCIAQNSAQDYVDVHNKARLEVGVGNVTWDETVAAHAKNFSEQRKADCKLALSNSTYGENLFVSHGRYNYTGVDAVKYWVSKKQYYIYSNNTCAFNQVCMTYTQVVWKNSTKIGCARVVCDKSSPGVFIICNYDPPGHTKGEKPY